MLGRAKSLNQKLFPQFESLKQGRLSKLFDMYRDYTQALKDTFIVMKEKPKKTGVYVTGLGLSVYCNRNNADFESYRESVLDSSNKHSLISDLIRNRESSKEITRLMKCLAEGRLRRINLGICSVIVLDEHSQYNDIYEKHCTTVHSRLVHLDGWRERMVDVGFLQRWYNLEQVMINYDINEAEFT